MPPQGIESTQGRLDTFEVAHPVRRRGSNAKKRAPTTLSWPHKHPTPDSLARAGFYFYPSASSPDNARCFCCNVNLDGWDPADDPILEHYTHRPDCAWAICRYLKLKFGEDETIVEDPMSETYTNARMTTFEGWPHESKRGWKCKKEKMVEAGWHFDPSPGGEDGVTCSYCSTELAGWERKDDPFEEHLKREPDCAFFALCERFASNRPAKPKRARTSKAARASTQSNMSTMNDNISMSEIDDYDIMDAAEDDTIITTATTTSKAPRGRKKPVVKSTRAKAKKISIMEDESEPVEASELGLSTSQPARRGRAKKNANLNDSTMTTSELAQSTSHPVRKTKSKKTALLDDTTIDTNELEHSTSQPVRQNRRKASRQVSAQMETSIPEVASRSSRSKGKKSVIDMSEEPFEAVVTQAKQSKKRTSSNPEKEDPIVVSTISSPLANSLQRSAGQGRGTKRASDGSPRLHTPKARLSALDKLDSSVIVLDTIPVIFEDSPDKPAKRARKTSSIRPPLQELEPAEVQRDSDAFMLRSSNLFDANASTPRQGTPEASSNGGSPVPPSPTPARNSLTADQRSIQHAHTKATPLPQQNSTRVAAPSVSPQSSDAENKPPSVRPPIRPLQLQPASPARIALATTPKASPSKRDMIMSNIQTTVKWTPSDLEMVFMRSPAKKASLDKENFFPDIADLDMKNLSETQLEHTIKSVRNTITEAERGMTVAQWIEHTGNIAAEKLKLECEIMVSMFESEAAKGMQTLESIEVIR